MEEKKLKKLARPTIIALLIALVTIVWFLLGSAAEFAFFEVSTGYTLAFTEIETFSNGLFGWVTELQNLINGGFDFATISDYIVFLPLVVGGIFALLLVIVLIVLLFKRNKRAIGSVIFIAITSFLIYALFELLSMIAINNLTGVTFQSYIAQAGTFNQVSDLVVVSDVATLTSAYYVALAALALLSIISTIYVYIKLMLVEVPRKMAVVTEAEEPIEEAVEETLASTFVQPQPEQKLETPKTEVKEQAVATEEPQPKRKVVFSLKRNPMPGYPYSPRDDEEVPPRDHRPPFVEEDHAGGLTKDDIRRIVRTEIREVIELLKVKPTERVVVREVVREVAKKEEPKEEKPKPKPTSKTVEVRVQKEAQADQDEDKKKVERIPFSRRILEASDEIREHYNNLKSLLKSYGLNNRVSNGGDTFRLHRVTYCKITIAGKALKLYLALDPNDYANTTLPIKDASSKAIYQEIPLTFKVKSSLSYRRAEQLIRDCMEKHNVEQIDQVYVTDWASRLEEEANLTDDYDDFED